MILHRPDGYGEMPGDLPYGRRVSRGLSEVPDEAQYLALPVGEHDLSSRFLSIYYTNV